MQAAVITCSGQPELLTLQEIPPPIPGPGQVLVRVHAASLNKLDCYVVRGPLFFLPFLGRLFKPRFQVAGADLAGRVTALGPGVTRLQPDDEVFGSAFGKDSMGAFAEYACASEDTLPPKPPSLSFAQAAAVPTAAITALQGLRDHGSLRPASRFSSMAPQAESTPSPSSLRKSWEPKSPPSAAPAISPGHPPGMRLPRYRIQRAPPGLASETWSLPPRPTPPPPTSGCGCPRSHL